MGIKLINEIMDFAPRMTAAEWKAMVILAEDANDSTRLTWSCVTSDKIMRRLGLSPRAATNMRGELVRKGLLEVAAAGRRGQVAKYRFPDFRAMGHPTGDESEPFRHPTDDLSDAMGHPTDDETSPMGHPTGDPRTERVTQQVTPTPLKPSSRSKASSKTTSSSRSARDSPPEWVATEEGEGGNFSKDLPVVINPDDEHTHQALIFVDKLPYDRQPTTQERADLVHHATRWFAAGWTHNALMAKCDSNLDTARDRINTWLSARRLGAEPCPPPVSPRAAGGGHQTFRDADPSGYGSPKKHRGYQNPIDPDAYKGTF